MHNLRYNIDKVADRKNLEALASHLGTRVFVAVACLGRPYIILNVGVVASDGHLTALCNGLLVPCNLHGSHHRLTGVAEAARWTMIEDIPLTVYLLQRTVSVVAEVRCDEFRTVLVEHDAARVNQYTSRTPRSQWAVGIAQSGVGIAQAVFLAAVTREHHHIFVAHLTYAAGLEEVEVQRILSFVECFVLAASLVEQTAVGAAGRDERVDGLGAFALREHGVLVEFYSR